MSDIWKFSGYGFDVRDYWHKFWMSEERINSIALSLINWFSESEYLLIFSKYHKLELFSDLLNLNTFSRKDLQEVFC